MLKAYAMCLAPSALMLFAYIFIPNVYNYVSSRYYLKPYNDVEFNWLPIITNLRFFNFLLILWVLKNVENPSSFIFDKIKETLTFFSEFN